MPKVTDAYRESRRDEIAHAAVRCLIRHGFAGTSMADIIAESGLSAGAIYSHFTSKTEITRHVARLVITSRSDELAAHVASLARPISPAETIVFMMGALEDAQVPKSVVLQVWAQATVDDELHELMLDAVAQLRAGYSSAVRPWLEARGQGGAVTDVEVANATSTMLAVSQGYIVHSALVGATDPARYLASAAALLG